VTGAALDLNVHHRFAQKRSPAMYMNVQVPPEKTSPQAEKTTARKGPSLGDMSAVTADALFGY